MYILCLIFMVKPIKLYTSVFIANSDWNGQKWQHWGRRQASPLQYDLSSERSIESPYEMSALHFLNHLAIEICQPRTFKFNQSLGYGSILCVWGRGGQWVQRPLRHNNTILQDICGRSNTAGLLRVHRGQSSNRPASMVWTKWNAPTVALFGQAGVPTHEANMSSVETVKPQHGWWGSERASKFFCRASWEKKKKREWWIVFVPVSESFLINWKFKNNKNIVQEETFSIFGDPKPGSKGFISVLKNKNSVHVCTCAMQCKHYRDSSSFGISESQMTSVQLQQLFLVLLVVHWWCVGGGWGNVSAMQGTLSPLWRSAWSFVTSVSLWSSMQPANRPANQCPGSLWAYCSWVWQWRACPASAYSLPCFSLSMWWHSFSAGPSFRPMYFMIMSLLSSIRAFPSISCRKQRTGRITLNRHREKPTPAKANRPAETYVFSE